MPKAERKVRGWRDERAQPIPTTMEPEELTSRPSGTPIETTRSYTAKEIGDTARSTRALTLDQMTVASSSGQKRGSHTCVSPSFFYYNLNMETNFNGSDWGEYSEFEFRWLEMLLTHKVLSSEFVFSLAAKFNIKFSGQVDDAEIGGVILSDVKREKLLPEIQHYFQENTSIPNYYEALEIYKSLDSLGASAFDKIFNYFLTDNSIKLINLSKSQKIFLILESIYKNLM